MHLIQGISSEWLRIGKNSLRRYVQCTRQYAKSFSSVEKHTGSNDLDVIDIFLHFILALVLKKKKNY